MPEKFSLSQQHTGHNTTGLKCTRRRPTVFIYFAESIKLRYLTAVILDNYASM